MGRDWGLVIPARSEAEVFPARSEAEVIPAKAEAKVIRRRPGSKFRLQNWAPACAGATIDGLDCLLSVS